MTMDNIFPKRTLGELEFRSRLAWLINKNLIAVLSLAVY